MLERNREEGSTDGDRARTALQVPSAAPNGASAEGQDDGEQGQAMAQAGEAEIQARAIETSIVIRDDD
jgi:hypothetical protein